MRRVIDQPALIVRKLELIADICLENWRGRCQLQCVLLHCDCLWFLCQRTLNFGISLRALRWWQSYHGVGLGHVRHHVD